MHFADNCKLTIYLFTSSTHRFIRICGRVSRTGVGFPRLSFSRRPASSLATLGNLVLPDALLRWTRQSGTKQISFVHDRLCRVKLCWSFVVIT